MLTIALVLVLAPFVILTIQKGTSIRTGKIGEGWLERMFDSKGTDAGFGALGAIATRGGREQIMDIASVFVNEVIERASKKGKKSRIQSLISQTQSDLVPGETRLVTFKAHRAPRGTLRLLAFTIVAVPILWKQSILTITDQRVLVHRLRRKKAELLSADNIVDISVKEWYKGFSALERGKTVLILNRRSRSKLRLEMINYWTTEARAAFEILAVVSFDPPPALARYWARLAS